MKALSTASDNIYRETVTSARRDTATAVAGDIQLSIRMIQPGDKQKLVDGFQRLSANSRYFRFFNHKNVLTLTELRFFTEFDGMNHVALGAFELTTTGAEGALVGVARFIRHPNATEVAEFSLVVVDDWQGLGIGRLLLKRLLAAAAERGVEQFQGDLLVENHRMRKLISRICAEADFHRDGSVVAVKFPVPKPTPSSQISLVMSAASNDGQKAANVTFPLGDFKLENGAVIHDTFLTYVTHGTLNSDKSNAILVLPPFMGGRHYHHYLIGPGKALDPSKHFIIAVDTFGNGHASSPSNSKRQPRSQFPKFSIRDMVDAQYQLITQVFGIQRLMAVIGFSMGGMQSYQWAVSYPETMRAIIPIASQVKSTPWQSVIYESWRKALMADATWNNGHYEEQPEAGLRAAANAISAWGRHFDWYEDDSGLTTQETPTWLKKAEDTCLKTWDANNFIYQTWALEAHNIGNTPGMNGDYRAALRSIQATVLLLPSKTDLLTPAKDSHDAAHYLNQVRLEEIPSTIGHLGGGGARSADIAFIAKPISAFLETVSASNQAN